MMLCFAGCNEIDIMKAENGASETAFHLPFVQQNSTKGGDVMTQEEFRSEMKISEENAFRKLFDEYCSYVYTIVFNRLRSCASRSDIDECVGDVFSSIYRSFNKDGLHEGDMSGFIGIIARRKAAQYYNRLTFVKNPLPLDDDEILLLRSDDDVERTVADNQLQQIILDKIIELGEPDSTIILQKYYYNRSASEISEIVHMKPENIRVRSGRAVKKLKELLENAGITL